MAKQKMKRLTAELGELFKQLNELESVIKKNLGFVGIRIEILNMKG